MKTSLYILCISLILGSCKKIDLQEEEEKGTAENTLSATAILGTGEGTATKPYTVNDIIGGKAKETTEVWVIGYVVGATQRTMTNAVFAANTTFESSILISDKQDAQSPETCIPIELSTSKNKKAFSLPSNPTGFRQCIVLQGNIRTYLNKNGLRDIRAGQWLFGFDISTVLSSPQEWEVEEIY